KAEQLYIQILGEELPIDIELVRKETKRLANQIKNVISSVVIRRNRLDLKQDFEYSKEVDELSTIEDPKELFYKLTPKQSDFYDQIIQEYFVEEGRFKGAIYQPFSYENPVSDSDGLDEEENRAFQQQRNLYDFMRRLLVKRFESSFGAFSKSIDRFLKVHKVVQDFIKNSGGKYILDRSLIESIYENDEDAILNTLEKFEKGLLERKIPKNNTVYEVDKFHRKDQFLKDIKSDELLFEEIRQKINSLNIVENDPKREALYEEVKSIVETKKENRKVIVFSEYVDTIKHLQGYLRNHFGNKLLVCDGKVSKELAKHLNSDFNAQYKGTQTDHFDVLITSDKLSEGFNLNRAGAIINYDIPWNPTRVIQRVGRINRIGSKVFNELYIYNFFPSETGADVVKSREIASQKMFLIHNSLGEDAKIFEPDEEPTASGLYSKINENPDDDDEVNVLTKIRNEFFEVKKEHPEVISRIEELPYRVKTAKNFERHQLSVLTKKGLSLFAQVVNEPSTASTEQNEVQEISFAELLPFVECGFEEKRLELSSEFWGAYNSVKSFKPKFRKSKSELSLDSKALTNLKLGLKLINPKEEETAEFMKVLIHDIRKYRTLSNRTLGRLGRKKISKASSKDEQKVFFDEVYWIKSHLGIDYLDRILDRVKNQKNEVIIAVENQ
ncbi:MAG: C-terminal helicase domain-containing protein, partial [Balneola sp.]